MTNTTNTKVNFLMQITAYPELLGVEYIFNEKSNLNAMAESLYEELQDLASTNFYSVLSDAQYFLDNDNVVDYLISQLKSVSPEFKSEVLGLDSMEDFLEKNEPNTPLEKSDEIFGYSFWDEVFSDNTEQLQKLFQIDSLSEIREKVFLHANKMIEDSPRKEHLRVSFEVIYSFEPKHFFEGLAANQPHLSKFLLDHATVIEAFIGQEKQNPFSMKETVSMEVNKSKIKIF